jgi:putative PIN family toxin of toxin-antitoxin system
VRIVLDTNVLIAALIARGVCHELLEHCALRHTVLTSEFILNEVAEKLVGKFGYSEELSTSAISIFRSRLEIVITLSLDSPVCRDPDDDNILAAAISGNGDCVVTGDKDLLVLKRYEGIDIFSPRDFLNQERID